MRLAKLVLLGAFTFAFLGLGSTQGTTAHAQVSVTFGAEPDCPYGYYAYAPYNCAPYGYYGPEWFNNGRFIGAGHWYHGPANFHGQVDNHYDPQHGYHGAMPNRGDHPAQNQVYGRTQGQGQQQGNGQNQGHGQSFHGNETRDGQGHVVGQGNNGGHNDSNHNGGGH